MTLGEGILWSTISLLIAGAIYQVSIHHKWKVVSKTFAGLILIGILIGSGVWGWNAYQERPQVVDELNGISLGMRSVEVSVLKGEPSNKDSHHSKPHKRETDGEFQMLWVFRPNGDSNDMEIAVFSGEIAEKMTVYRVCQRGGYNTLLGFGQGDLERDVRQKLGEPSFVSFNKDGLSKWLSYEKWKASFDISKGRIVSFCLSESGRMAYSEEYGSGQAESDLGDPENSE